MSTSNGERNEMNSTGPIPLRAGRTAEVVCWMVAAMLLVAGAASCSDRGREEERDVPVVEPPDTAGSETGPDTGVDTGETEDDTGPDVIRRVVDRELFGDMPPENLVLDPLFRGRRSWIPLELSGGQPSDYMEAYREAHARTPMSAPVLRVPGEGVSASVRILGGVVLRQAPTEVSIWIGRPDEFDESAEVAVLGVTSSDATQMTTVELSVDSSAQREVGGLKWTRYSETVTGFFGRGYLRVEAEVDAPLYLHAPVAVTTEANPGALRAGTEVDSRPASRLDRLSVQFAREWERRHRPDPRDVMFGPPRHLFEPTTP